MWWISQSYVIENANCKYGVLEVLCCLFSSLHSLSLELKLTGKDVGYTYTLDRRFSKIKEPVLTHDQRFSENHGTSSDPWPAVLRKSKNQFWPTLDQRFSENHRTSFWPLPQGIENQFFSENPHLEVYLILKRLRNRNWRLYASEHFQKNQNWRPPWVKCKNPEPGVICKINELQNTGFLLVLDIYIYSNLGIKYW